MADPSIRRSLSLRLKDIHPSKAAWAAWSRTVSRDASLQQAEQRRTAPDRGDDAHHGSGGDQRAAPPRTLRSRDIYVPDVHIGTLKVKTRDFR